MSAKVVHVSPDGPAIRGSADALGVIYADGAEDAEWIVVPVVRLDPAFFDLRSGLAGDLLQTFANYRVGLVVVGDVTDHVSASPALADFIRERTAAGRSGSCQTRLSSGTAWARARRDRRLPRVAY